MIFDPSTLYLVRFPTISAGNTTSSSIASCTEVRVRLRGLCAADPFFGGLKILLVAIRITSYHRTTMVYEQIEYENAKSINLHDTI